MCKLSHGPSLERAKRRSVITFWSRGVIGSRVRLRSVSERVWVRFPPGPPPLSYRSSMGERCPVLDGRCVSDPRRYEEIFWPCRPIGRSRFPQKDDSMGSNPLMATISGPKYLGVRCSVCRRSYGDRNIAGLMMAPDMPNGM